MAAPVDPGRQAEDPAVGARLAQREVVDAQQVGVDADAESRTEETQSGGGAEHGGGIHRAAPRPGSARADAQVEDAGHRAGTRHEPGADLATRICARLAGAWT